GGIFSNGALTLTNSTVSGNQAAGSGGGIFSNGALTLTNSTVSGNQAAGSGGGIFSNGALTLTNSTVSGNSAANNGGGVWSYAGGTITNSTITNNIADSDANNTGDGGGIFRYGGTFTIRNSIIAGNFDRSPAGNIHPDVSGDNINGDANNLIGDATGATGTSTIGTGSDRTFATAGITNINQVLAPLANNGGSTQTHALVPGSAALDAGNNANAPAGTDQRGATRIFNNTVDIGAVEMQFVLQPSNTPQSTQVSTAFANPLSVQLADAFTNTTVAFAGLAVNFAAPGSGASGSFSNGVTVLTNAQGIAVNPFTANGIAGNYQVTATATGTRLATFDLTNTALSTTPATPTTTNPGTTPTPTAPTPQLTAPPESNTPPDIQDPPQTAATTPVLACSGAANNSNFAPLNLKIPTIAGLMNAGGGSTSSSLSGLASECGSSLAAVQGNQQLANAYLQSAIAEQIGTEYADLVQIRLVSSAEGITAIIEVQPAPSPAFVTTEDESIFYLYEDGNVRDLDPEAIERYQQQRWQE
ncbi:MAG: right-handed parallel beta-helix repeat-containing protein, partial [Jaaginema sp. PMC 1078.18]|nr:right-handed parallel beta-helix repeat-containing protein [Jaaginema sp. PMC 1078.18]